MHEDERRKRKKKEWTGVLLILTFSVQDRNR